MSSTSQSPDGKPESMNEPEKKKAGSPGRYSLADEGDEVPPTRIDSTTRMPAVRPDGAVPSSPSSDVSSARAPGSLRDPAASSASIAASRASIARVERDSADTKKKAPVGLPSRATPTQRAASAPASRGAVAPPAQRTSDAKGPTSGRLPDVRPPAKSSDFTAEARSLEPPSRVSAPKPGAAARVETSGESAEVAPATARAPVRPPSVAPPGSRRISSLRPPPSPKPPSAPPAESFVLDGFDEGSIAFAFDALVSEDRASLPGTHEFDLAPVRELFAELAANHMRHVRDFMIDVKWGEVTRDWIHICVPPVRTLRKAAERLELVELGASLEKLGDELDAANAVGGQMLDANEKQRLLDAYGELVAILPQAFGLDRDKTQREAVIVQALLLQVPDVRKVTIDKLHAAGLTSLTELFAANAHDIAHVAGIPHALAMRIVERVQSYRAELKSSSPQDARAAEREKLAALNAQLKQHHDAYEEAANAWGPEAKSKKREHFRAREETWLEVSVLLARFGEVDRLQGIEKVPFSQRIAQLSDYVEEARDKYRSPEG
ncbi:MAG: hypothetical protein KF894_32450 [Labilithrix sp.]|nr:hypothetical protein [Labilithrix sp.]